MSAKPVAESLEAQIWRVVAQLDRASPEPESGHGLDALSVCFRALREAGGTARSAATEQIWALWCDHPEEELRDQMASGIRSLSVGDLAGAEAVFDGLVERDPGWAEAWNKRATVYFLQGRDADSVDDISHTLELEPRHFGALGGFSQICMRNGVPDAARAALERLQAVDAGVPGIAEALVALETRYPKTLH